MTAPRRPRGAGPLRGDRDHARYRKGGTYGSSLLTGIPSTFFACEKKPESSDHFTLVFDKPVRVKSIAVVTGRPDGKDALDAGKLEVSGDGTTFAEVARFADGKVKAMPTDNAVKAIRMPLAAALSHPLAIREFSIESEPPVVVFKYPVEFMIDVSDEPTMRDWARERGEGLCARATP